MTESTIVDPYEILQVQRSALPEVVRAAYRALAWKYHPDRGAPSDRMVAINEAWRILGNPVRRA
ncbi:MAG: J domain-containing protein, partial [Chloroflexota bacterium]